MDLSKRMSEQETKRVKAFVCWPIAERAGYGDDNSLTWTTWRENTTYIDNVNILERTVSSPNFGLDTW